MMPMTASVSTQAAAPPRGLGEQVDAEAQQAVGAELQHHAGEDDRAARRRLGVGVGQPRVQREDRHLDGERDGEGEEQPSAGRRREVGLVGDLDEVERDVADVALGAGTPWR